MVLLHSSATGCIGVTDSIGTIHGPAFLFDPRSTPSVTVFGFVCTLWIPQLPAQRHRNGDRHWISAARVSSRISRLLRTARGNETSGPPCCCRTSSVAAGCGPGSTRGGARGGRAATDVSAIVCLADALCERRLAGSATARRARRPSRPSASEASGGAGGANGGDASSPLGWLLGVRKARPPPCLARGVANTAPASSAEPSLMLL